MVKVSHFVLAGSILSVSLLAGCGGTSKQADPSPAKGKEHVPVTLSILPQPGDAPNFQQLYVDPVKKKYPYITLNMVELPKGQSIDNLVTAGNIPDIIGVWNGGLGQLNQLNLTEDLSSYLKKDNVDLNDFQPNLLDAVRDNGKLLALPYSQNFNVIFYNKDIFDKFGVSYPKAGMTWQDAIQLAKSLTRLDGGVQYRGLEVEGTSRLTFQRSLNYIDAGTNKASVNNDSMKQVLQVFQAIYSIPGNLPNHPVSNQKLNLNDFVKDKNLAMYATVNKLSQISDVQGLNWGMAQYPSFPDQPNTYGMPDEHVNVLSSQSKNKEEAIKVIELLSSATAQKDMTSQLGQFTILKDPSIIKAFGQGIPEIKNKIDQSVFKSSPAPAKPFSDFYADARNVFDTEASNMLTNGEDSNTVMRTAEAKINQLIASQAK